MSLKPLPLACGALLAVALPVHAAEAADALTWAFAQQRALHRELTDALRALEQTADAGAALWLIAASFVYGVLHAAGPGHGKAVLSAYLLTHPARVRRGAALGAVASLAQGVTAIVLVYGLIWLAGWRAGETAAAVSWSERLSYAMLAGMGAWLSVRAVRSLAALLRPAPLPATGHDHHHHHHDHHHGCGCAHAPSAAEVEAATDWRAGLGLALSIGLRPCSGAVLVLVFAYSLKIAWAGMLAAMAMATGTAITVAALALLAVQARGLAARLAAGRSGRAAARIGAAAALCGGLAVTLVGCELLLQAFAAPRPMGIL